MDDDGLGLHREGSGNAVPDFGLVADGDSLGAEGSAPLGEIRVGELGALHERAFWIANIRMHADRAVHAVVGDDHDRVGAILAGGRDLIAYLKDATTTE